MSFGLAGEPFYNSTKFLSWCVEFEPSLERDWTANEFFFVCFLQDGAAGRRRSSCGLHLGTGTHHDGGRSGGSHGLPSAGRSLCLCAEEGGDYELRANQLTVFKDLGDFKTNQDSGN